MASSIQELIIIGASARAAAFSALHGGLAPYCADLFADADLAARCAVCRIEGYPEGFAAALEDLPAAPWMYTGGLENHPELIDRLTSDRPLLGNAGPVLRRVRNPAELSNVLANCACRFPDWQPTARGLPRDGSWLRKGYRSAGGALVAPWTDMARSGEETRFYFQRRVAGQPAAAVYVAAGGRAVLLGVTAQIIGAEWTGAAPFRYAGSLGPLTLAPQTQAALVELGDRLAGKFALQGLLGIDVMLSEEGVYAVDVNPRFPASVELLERAFGFSAVRLHVEACRGKLPARSEPIQRGVFGKAILFARSRCMIDPRMASRLQAAMSRAEWPEIADVPAEGSTIEAGRPVITVFAQAEHLADLEQRLVAEVASWRQLLEPCTIPSDPPQERT